MSELLDWLGAIIRWADVFAGFAICAIAWIRFRSHGSLLAVSAFLVMMTGSVTRLILPWLWSQYSDLTAQELGAISVFVGSISGAGMIVLIFALRRLIAAAEIAENSGVVDGEDS